MSRFFRRQPLLRKTARCSAASTSPCCSCCCRWWAAGRGGWPRCGMPRHC
ncbi:unnamed protein product [Polarella glacialis]|uniref:Uncharacterized protein n=1 Tax=Polarella glacialis TaxID=89957 RepID=A0A813HAA2_POLGL|nr:unnamed protein product [Polarella glacialis]